MSGFTLLHTSDWHLGHQIYQRHRDDEFAGFLGWLNEVIRVNQVDCLIIAGDVFDTAVPSVTAQKQYYDFLLNAARAGTTNIIITAGNHDSPAFLTAAAQILRSLRVHVIGAISDKPEEEIITLRDGSGQMRAIICAVPYLREKDARRATPGESIRDREASLAAGIGEHYSRIAGLAETARAGRDVPVIATGHLFTTGATGGDSERNLYIGALGALPSNVFPETFDYVALGHIHKPQKIGASETRRYSGSPLPMSFAEAGQKKGAVLVRFDGRNAQIKTLPVPEFRSFMTLRGSSETVLGQLAALARENREAWLEIEHDGTDSFARLKEEGEAAVEGTHLEILNIKPCRTIGGAVVNDSRGLEDVTPQDIFEQRLDDAGVKGADRDKMLAAFRELLDLWQQGQGNGGE